MLISTEDDEELVALRNVIIPEAMKRLEACGSDGMGQDDLAAWLIDEHRDRVIAVLGCCIGDALERADDERRLRASFRGAGVPDEADALLRGISETLGLPQWYLCKLTWVRLEPLTKAVSLVLGLRQEIDQAQIDAMEALMNRIAPVLESAASAGLPEPNVGQALELLEQQTAETLRKIEDEKS